MIFPADSAVHPGKGQRDREGYLQRMQKAEIRNNREELLQGDQREGSLQMPEEVPEELYKMAEEARRRAEDGEIQVKTNIDSSPGSH